MSDEKQLDAVKAKIQELTKDEKFIEKILAMETPEEVQKAFAEKGVEFSLDEVGLMGQAINETVEQGVTGLNNDDLENVSGGRVQAGRAVKNFGLFVKSMGELAALGSAVGVLMGCYAVEKGAQKAGKGIKKGAVKAGNWLSKHKKEIAVGAGAAAAGLATGLLAQKENRERISTWFDEKFIPNKPYIGSDGKEYID